MLLDTNEFRACLARAGITQKELAKRIGIAEQTMTRKIKKGVFCTNEVEKIVRVLNIENPAQIFLGN